MVSPLALAIDAFVITLLAASTVYTSKMMKSVKGQTARPWALIFLANVTFLVGGGTQFYADFVESSALSPFLLFAVPALSFLVMGLVYGYHYVIGNNLLVELVIYALKRHGFSVKKGAKIAGRTGIDHLFDIVAERSDTAMAIDVKSSMLDVGEVPIVQLFLKAIDIATLRPVLLATPRISEAGRKLATTFRLTVLEGRSNTDVLSELEAFLESVSTKKGVDQKNLGLNR